MKEKTVLLLRLVIGFLFIFSAYSKIISPGLIEIILVDHGLTATRESAAVLVRILIGFEFALGLLFFQPYSIKKIVVPLSFLFLCAFTVYLGYTAVILKDSQNCGCFGEMIKMSPVASIIKNILWMILLIWIYRWSGERKNYLIPPIILTLTIAAVFIAVPVKSNENNAFAGYTSFIGGGRVDLSEGNKLIVIMNTECDHCQALAKELVNLKKKMKSLPELYTLYYSEGSVSPDSFRVLTKFYLPYRVLDMNKFLNLIGQSPPRIYWLKEGKIEQTWDKDFVKNIENNFLERR